MALTIFLFLRGAAIPQILPFSFPDEVEEGQLLQVSCIVTIGDEPLTVQWFKDNIPLDSSPKFVINHMNSKMSLLILYEVGMQHSGLYTCSASNLVGKADTSALLKVQGTSKR